VDANAEPSASAGNKKASRKSLGQFILSSVGRSVGWEVAATVVVEMKKVPCQVGLESWVKI
jgi:hypothetical protein